MQDQASTQREETEGHKRWVGRKWDNEKISYVLHGKDDLRYLFSSARHLDITCRYREIWPGKTIRT
jgi:hypothetical protein